MSHNSNILPVDVEVDEAGRSVRDAVAGLVAEHALAVVVDGRRRPDADGSTVEHVRQLVIAGFLVALLLGRALLERRAPVAVADALPLLDGRMGRRWVLLLLLRPVRFHSGFHQRLLDG